MYVRRLRNVDKNVDSKEGQVHRVKHFREKMGLTQEDVAKRLGLTKGGYALKEQGRREFTIAEAKILCRIFNQCFEKIF